jgi:hypothetical protein
MYETKTGRLTERILKLRVGVFSGKTLLLLLMLPVVVIVLRLIIWRVPVLLTHLLALDAILIMLYLIGRVLIAYVESRTARFPERLLRSVQARATITISREIALRTAAQQGYRCDFESGSGVRSPVTALLAALLLIAGLVSLIPTGVYDYLHNFSGIAYLGTGNPLPLDSEESYGIYARGPLASYAEISMKMKGYDIILPDLTYPQGAKELALLANDGHELWRGVLVPGERHRQGRYDFYMEGFVYDLFVAIGTVEGHGIFGSRVRVVPLPAPVEGYTHTGTFEAPLDKANGTIWFDMRTDRTKIMLKHAGKITEATVGTSGDTVSTVDGYRFNLAGIGRWTHINVLRVRHIYLMKAGGIVLLLGLVLKLLMPVRRFKLETNPDGSTKLLTNDTKLLHLVKGKGELLS